MWIHDDIQTYTLVLEGHCFLNWLSFHKLPSVSVTATKLVAKFQSPSGAKENLDEVGLFLRQSDPGQKLVKLGLHPGFSILLVAPEDTLMKNRARCQIGYGEHHGLFLHGTLVHVM